MGRKLNKVVKHSRNHKRIQARKRKREAQIWEEAQEKLAKAGATDDAEDDVVLDVTEYEVMEMDSTEESTCNTSRINNGNLQKNSVSNYQIKINSRESSISSVDLRSLDDYQDSNHSVIRTFRQSTDFDTSGLDSSNSNRGQHSRSASVENASNIIRACSKESDSQAAELNDIEYSESQVAFASLEILNNQKLSEFEEFGLSSLNLCSFREPSVVARKETMPHEFSQETYDTEYLSCDEISNGEVSSIAIHHNVSQETHDTEYLSCDELNNCEMPFELINNRRDDQNENSFIHANDDSNHSHLDQSSDFVDSNGHFPFVSENQNVEPDNISQETQSRLNDDISDEDVDNSHHSLPASSNTSASVISGRRIFEPMFYHEQLKNFGKAENHTLNCSRLLENIDITESYDIGLNTLIYFKCLECQLIKKVYTNPLKPKNAFTINETSVLAAIGTGSTFTAFQSTLAIFDIPYISHHTFSKYREKFNHHIDVALADEMKEAALEEAKIAINKGDVTSDGIPFIKVIIDGCFGKRSYPGGKYDSLGAAVGIIGQATQKLIDLEVLNKYCKICRVAENRDINPPKHPCYKNYDRNQSSGSMEAAGAVKIFNRSIELNGLIYIIVIGDDDSSSYKAIRAANPYQKYGITVEKIKCTNHMWRRFGTHITEASNAKAIKSYGVGVVRDKIKTSGIKIRKIISNEIDLLTKDLDLNKLSKSEDEVKQFKEKTEQLQEAIKLAPYHVFGNHENCLPHWNCDHSKPNFVPKIVEYGLLAGVEKVMEKFCLNATHLLHKVTTNAIEQCFSIVSKYITGKRNNYFSSSGYKDRVSVAAIDQITGTPLTKIFSHSEVNVPQNVVKIEKEHVLQRLRNKKYREANKNKNKRHRRSQGADKDYGPNAAQPDLAETDQELYQQQKEAHNDKLRERQQNRVILETKTRDEIRYGEYHAFETDMIPSFLFGKICKMAETSSCIPVVNNICNPVVYDDDQLQLMEDQRTTALRELESMIGSKISPCGIFISDDKNSFYLCARPDGTVEDDSIVVVCNISEDKQTSVDEALNSNRNLANLFSSKLPDQINTSHLMYYYIQGQLHVCGKKFCHFAVYTPLGLKLAELIVRDDSFWDDRMRGKLERFYHQALIDEIIDSRLERSMPIREAPFTKDAKAEKAKKNVEKSAKMTEKPPEKQKPCKRPPNKQLLTKHLPTKYQKVSKTFRNSSVDDYDQDFIDSYRQTVLSRTDDQFLVDILTDRNYLDDISISSFLLLLEDKGFSIQFPITILNPLKPSTSSNDLLIIGGHQSNPHWYCLHFNGQNVFIYDSMNRNNFSQMSEVERNYITVRYPKQVNEDRVIFKEVTRQPDGSSCGVYAAAYATTIALGGDPSDFVYSQDAAIMRQHLYAQIILPRQLVHFPGSEEN